MSWERHGGLRAAIAQLAAQIMYGEQVKQYFTAKRLAAKRLLGPAGARNARHRPRDLPSNGEIKAALLELVLEIEGEGHETRLFAMRIVALEAMDALLTLRPRLIGSVATGHVRDGSDVDIHVFAEHPDEVVRRVRELGWIFELTTANVLKHGKPHTFVHLHVADLFPIELTIYDPRELRFRPRSSTDGKPIVRLTPTALRKRMAVDHPERWQRYLASGEVPTLDEILACAEEAQAVSPYLELDRHVERQ
jgi:hypothetical protein